MSEEMNNNVQPAEAPERRTHRGSYHRPRLSST